MRGDDVTCEYEYRVSEGVILRRPIHVCLLEAWGPRDAKWFDYPHILKDWLYESRQLAAADVPEAARTAPSIWREVVENGQRAGWTRGPSVGGSGEGTTITMAAAARMAELERKMGDLYRAAAMASRRPATPSPSPAADATNAAEAQDRRGIEAYFTTSSGAESVTSSRNTTCSSRRSTGRSAILTPPGGSPCPGCMVASGTG